MPVKYTPEMFVAAFWAKVEKTPTCWLWRGKVRVARGERRGVAWDGERGKWRYAHHVALEMTLGRPITTGFQVNHTCDNPLCVRNDDEAHVYEGTQAQNIKDMHARGRATKARGSGHGMSRLTESKVRDIKLGLRNGDSQISLATRMGVSKQTISEIARGNIWVHVII